MIRVPSDYDPDAAIVVVDVGNTTTRTATWQEGELRTPLAAATEDADAFAKALSAHCAACPDGRPAAVAIGSVVPSALGRIKSFVEQQLDRPALVVGERIPLPIEVGVADSQAVGVDRVCAAAAAYDKVQAACTVADFGSAVTVDLVDDDGVFLGGAILPGLAMQLRALHEYTAALPQVAAAIPEHHYGRDTEEAIQTGVCRGLVGAVRGLVEGYATRLGRWPQVVGTGGDLELLMPHCDFLDTTVAHLTLRGIGLAYTRHISRLDT